MHISCLWTCSMILFWKQHVFFFYLRWNCETMLKESVGISQLDFLSKKKANKLHKEKSHEIEHSTHSLWLFLFNSFLLQQRQSFDCVTQVEIKKNHWNHLKIAIEK